MIEFAATGMTCGHGERAVRPALARAAPGAGVEIDRAAGRVRIAGPAALAAIAAAIAAEGRGGTPA